MLNLVSRTILARGAVLLLAQLGQTRKTAATIHLNFSAAAQERSIEDAGSSTYRAERRRMHSVEGVSALCDRSQKTVASDYSWCMAGM